MFERMREMPNSVNVDEDDLGGPDAKLMSTSDSFLRYL